MYNIAQKKFLLDIYFTHQLSFFYHLNYASQKLSMLDVAVDNDLYLLIYIFK